MKKCPKCGHLDFDDANFCDQDRTALVFYQKDSSELVKVKEGRDEKDWNKWAEEMESLPEEEFIRRMKSFLSRTELIEIPELEKLFNRLME